MESTLFIVIVCDVHIMRKYIWFMRWIVMLWFISEIKAKLVVWSGALHWVSPGIGGRSDTGS